MIGGFNVEDDYFGRSRTGAWRDIGLMVEGPAAARLAPYYDAADRLGAAPRVAGSATLRQIIHRYSETRAAAVDSSAGRPQAVARGALRPAATCVHSRDVEMIAAYFAPTWAMLRRIARVGERGRARIITAAKSDNNATIAAARYTYGRLLRRGVEIFEYQPTKLHTKLVVLDDVVHIGSSNFDIRSLYLNMEMMLRVDDPEFAPLMRSYFEGELEQCLPITPRTAQQARDLAQPDALGAVLLPGDQRSITASPAG